MAKIKAEKKPKVNGKLSHSYDNPYCTPSNVQLDDFRCRMKDVLNLYLYMSQPDRTHPVIKRPKYVPFLRRNLHYMRPDVSYSLPRGNGATKNFNSKPSCSPMPLDDSTKHVDEDLLPCSFMCPSLSFYRVRFDDRRSEYDYADIQCYRAREINGQFEAMQAVEAAHFHMKLNEDQKIDIDLANFTPDLNESGKERFDYLLLKVEVRAEGISVSGGRKLRSVPARQAAQSELKQIGDPEHPANPQVETKIMFGVKQISIQKPGQQGHLIKEGKAQIVLIPASELNVDTENTKWTQDTDLVKRLLQILKRPPPPRQPTLRVEVFVDDDLSYSTAGSALSSARATPAPFEQKHTNGDSSNTRCLRQRSVDNISRFKSTLREISHSNSGTPRQSVEPPEQSCCSSASSVTNVSCSGGEKIERTGILGIVSKQHQAEMINAKVPQKLAWCFRMSDSSEVLNSNATNAQSKNHVNNAFSSFVDPPPADVFRFTGNECAICSPEYRRPFPSFISLLYHLCTMHPRLSFKFKKNLSPIVNNQAKRCSFSPTGSQKSSSTVSTSTTKRRYVKKEFDADSYVDQKPELKQCPGLIVSLNNAYNGAHEFDTSRHYIKRLALLRQGTGIKRIPGAWSKPPTFLVVKNLAQYLRTHPPPQTFDELETRNHLSDGTFGGCAQWQDQHFHTKRYVQRNAPFIQLTQRRRIRDYVDVNENEKQMLNILSDFHASFRSLLMGHQFYGWNVILVKERRSDLIRPSIYTQFIIHLTNLKGLGHLHEAEFFDLIARLRHEPPSEYDPRDDPKHFVHVALQRLERQRPASVENQKKNGRKSLPQARNSRELSTSSTDDSSSNTPRVPYPKRKRSFDSSTGHNSSVVSEKKPKLQENEASSEKKRQFNTQTPMDLLLQNTQLHPSQVPISCFDDLACRYQFASEKHLNKIWHFCREWTREYLEWQ